MDNQFSQNSTTQRRLPRSTRTASSKANAAAEDPFADRSEQPAQPAANPFASSEDPPKSASASVHSDSTASSRKDYRPGRSRYFHSRRVRKDEVIKPWVKEPRDPAEKWIEIIPLIGLLVGIGIAGILIWDGLRNVIDHKYCNVWVEDWSQGFDSKVWQPEIQVGGYG